LADVRIIEAIYKPARTGKAVRLSLQPKKKMLTLAQEIHRSAHGKPATFGVEPPSGDPA
jgi:hypothetical protein